MTASGRARWITGTVLALGAVSCAAILGIDTLPVDPPPAPAPDAGDAATADPCAHASPPPPPEKDDAEESVPPFYLAVRTLVFRGPPGAPSGFDLDGVCTCDPRPGTARDGGGACAAPESDCDDDGGIDNRAAAFFETFADVIDFDRVAGFEASAALGERTLLLHVAEYNGTANDRDVRIGIMPSRGILDGAGCGTAVDPKTGRAPPGWCGKDRWTYPAGSVVPGSKVPLQRVRGWVTGGILALRSETPVAVLLGPTMIDLGAPVAMGRLEKGGDGLFRLLDVVIGGRVHVNALLAAVGAYDAPKEADAGRPQLCQTTTFPALKASFCKQPDIRSSLGLDFQPGACDAISIAARFGAEQADVGAEHTPTTSTSPCDPSRVDAGLYACP